VGGEGDATFLLKKAMLCVQFASLPSLSIFVRLSTFKASSSSAGDPLYPLLISHLLSFSQEKIAIEQLLAEESW